MKTRESLKTVIGFIVLIISIIMIYRIHMLIPFMMDDLWYSTCLENDRPLSSFGDIITSQIWHYKNWGGRSITHGMLQLTLMSGETVANILNLIMTLLLSFLIAMNSVQKKIPYFAVSLGLLIGLNANWKMSMFWQAGVANYVYITVFILLFFYCYLREMEEQKRKLPGIGLWILPLGLIAGWSNENMGPSVWILSLIILIRAYLEKRGSLWMILGNLSCLAGSLLVILAPGNFIRSAEIEKVSPGLTIFLHIYSESKAALEFLFPTLLSVLFILILSKALTVSLWNRNLMFLLGALLSWGAMILSPHYPDRATFGTMVFLLCYIISQSSRIIQKKSELSFWMFGAGLVIWGRGMYFLAEYFSICNHWIR